VGCRTSPKPAAALEPAAFQDANRLYLAGDFARAREAYEGYLRQNLQTDLAADAHYRIALCALASGSPRDAVAALDRADAAHPDPPLSACICAARGDAAFAMDDFTGAARLYAEALRRGGGRERDSLLYRNGLALVRAGNWDLGEPILLSQLAREFPTSPWTRRAARVAEAERNFWIQVGSFTSDANAENIRRQAVERGWKARIFLGSSSSPAPPAAGSSTVAVRGQYAVRIGPYTTWNAAAKDLPTVRATGFEAIVFP
jgi:tetratricopeptide (TPR) repeat protein